MKKIFLISIIFANFLYSTTIDDVDGKVSVEISGSVNSSIEGVYTIPYSAKDKSNNEAQISRTITVLEDKGILKEDNDTTKEEWEKVLLNIKVLYEKDTPVNLQKLQVCSEKSCWTVLDSNNENIDITIDKEVTDIADNIALIDVRPLLNAENIEESLTMV